MTGSAQHGWRGERGGAVGPAVEHGAGLAAARQQRGVRLVAAESGYSVHATHTLTSIIISTDSSKLS